MQGITAQLDMARHDAAGRDMTQHHAVTMRICQTLDPGVRIDQEADRTLHSMPWHISVDRLLTLQKSVPCAYTLPRT